MTDSKKHVRFAVPREDNTRLVWPSDSPESLVDANEFIRSRYPDWLVQLTEQARREIGSLLESYNAVDACCGSCASRTHVGGFEPEAAQIGLTLPGEEMLPSASWIVSGHQPELFHSGVWFKNFYVDQVAKRLREQSRCAISVNIIVDHDLARAHSLRYSRWQSMGQLSPKLSETARTQHDRSDALQDRSQDGILLTTVHRMPWGASKVSQNADGSRPAAQGVVSWEQFTYDPSQDAQWDAWVDSIAQDGATLGLEPLIATRRSEFLQSLRDTRNVGEAFSRFRHRIERDHGVQNFELPMSAVTQTSSFGLFLRQCLLEAQRFVTVYNAARESFRRERDITNPAQPVPELQPSDGWLEFPFWVYSSSDDVHGLDYIDAPSAIKPGDPSNSHQTGAERKKLWVLEQESGWVLASEPSLQATTVLRLSRDSRQWDADWEALQSVGVPIRPRALTNTLFLRYILSDLFVHGIGGGIYDAVTDEIAREFWGVQSQEMLVASASIHLPYPEHVSDRSEIDRDRVTLNALQRRIRSAPESLLDSSVPEEAQLLTECRNMLSSIPPRGEKRAWHWEMKRLRDNVRQAIAGKVRQMELMAARLLERERQRKIVTSRETSFVLFEEEDVVRRLVTLLEVD